jgi:branched-subunit amino acid ABC-type transport system permease component
MDVLLFAVLGLATGGLYALVALSVLVVYRSSGVLNFAAGALGSLGSYVFYSLRDNHSVPTARILSNLGSLTKEWIHLDWLGPKQTTA